MKIRVEEWDVGLDNGCYCHTRLSVRLGIVGNFSISVPVAKHFNYFISMLNESAFKSTIAILFSYSR